MEFLKSACYFLAVLSALVIVHEWGHFIVAKMCGMRVDDFSLFFGPRIVRLGKRNGTEYNIRCIPLGGFVKIAGMEPEELGNPVFPLTDPDHLRKDINVVLAGLTADALGEINPEHVSNRVRGAVEQSVGEDGRLTEWGHDELQTLIHSTGINVDEQRYLQAILDTAAAKPDPRGYNQRPLWQRAATIFAGPLVSLLFAYLMFCVMGFTIGLPYDTRVEPVVEALSSQNLAAYKAGIRPGDRVVQIDDLKIPDGKTMIDKIHGSVGKSLRLVVLRNGAQKTFTAVPAAAKVTDVVNGKPVEMTIGQIGIVPQQTVLWRTYSPMGAVRRGTDIVVGQASMIVMMIVSRPKQLKENVGGILSIAGEIHEDSKEGPRRVLLTGASLSLSLGIMNLLPIPILDGGHLLMLAIEGIRRRKLSLAEVNRFQMVGISIIGVLFVLVMYNDIVRIFFHKH